MSADSSKQGENVNNQIFEYIVVLPDLATQSVWAETWHVVDGRLVFRVGSVDVAVFDYWSHFFMPRSEIERAEEIAREPKVTISIQSADPAAAAEEFGKSWKRIMAASRETATESEGETFIHPGIGFTVGRRETAEADPDSRMTCGRCKHWRRGFEAIDYGWGMCNVQIGHPPNNYPSMLGDKVKTSQTFSCSFYRGAAQEEAADA